MSILIMSGSQRKSSYSRGLAKAIFAALQARGIETSLWNFREKPLPIMQPDYYPQAEPYQNVFVTEFVQTAKAAQAIILVTPIYHNGPSGLLKNALDFLSFEHFKYKAVGLCSHGGQRTTQALEQLRTICRGLNAYAITTQVCTAAEDFKESPVDPILESPSCLERIQRFCDELCALSELLQNMP